MILDLSEQDLKSGVLGLVVALVEIIEEALRLQALRRMEAGSLSLAEIERLGQALSELEGAIERLKAETGSTESVKAVRDSLDKAVADAVGSLLDPYRWDRAQLEVGYGNS